MDRNIRQHTFRHVHLIKTPICLRIHAIWSCSLLFGWRNFASLAIYNAPSEDYQTARMRKLIWIFAVRTCPKVLFLDVAAQMVLTFMPARDKAYNKTCVTSKDSDQPVPPLSLASVLIYPILNSPEAVNTHEISEDWWDCADAQADLSLRWSHKSYSRFCRAQSHSKANYPEMNMNINHTYP